jgi:hypothetical protein
MLSYKAELYRGGPCAWEAGPEGAEECGSPAHPTESCRHVRGHSWRRRAAAGESLTPWLVLMAQLRERLELLEYQDAAMKLGEPKVLFFPGIESCLVSCGLDFEYYLILLFILCILIHSDNASG